MAFLEADPTYSATAESAAFKTLHNLAAAIGQMKATGQDYASLLPYYKRALDAYRAQGDADPANLTTFENFYLDAAQGLNVVGAFADAVGGRLLIGGIVALGILYLWKVKR